MLNIGLLHPSNISLHQLTASGLAAFGTFTGINSSELTGIQTNEEIVGFKCFPNPFTQEITIEVQIAKETEITAEIYNMSGQWIRTLFKGVNSGKLVLKWDGLNESGEPVAPGVYLCKVNGQSRQVVYQGNKGEH